MEAVDDVKRALGDAHEAALDMARSNGWSYDGSFERALSAVNNWAGGGGEQVESDLMAARRIADDWQRVADARAADLSKLQRELDDAYAIIKRLAEGLQEEFLG